MPGVFVSYSREDGVFVRELYAVLTDAGRDVWVDWEDIPAASEWERDINDSIDGAESFVFVVSTNSLASEYCATEFRHAQERGKRIVPIACDAADPEAAQPGLRQLNWIWCRDGDDRDAAFAKLSSALDTDLEWARAHTRLLVRAVDWETRQDNSLLLRGRDLAQAEQDLAANAANEPTPTELQHRYVLASRRAASRRQRTLLAGVTVALAVSVALGVVALLQRNTANERARIARSQALAAQAEGALSTAPATALDDSVKAIETSRTRQASLALRRAILANPVEYVIPAGPADARAAKRTDRVAREALAFSADGKLLVGLTPAGPPRAWRSEDGRPVARAIPPSKAPQASDPASAVSPDGRFRATIRNGRAELWSRDLRTRIARLGPAVRVLFSHDSRLLVTVGENGEAGVWRSSSGRLVAALPGSGSLYPSVGSWTTPFTPGAAFSTDGRLLALAGADGIVRVWELATRTPVSAVAMGWVNTLAFAPRGGLLAGMTWDGDVVVARTPASITLRTGFRPSGCSASFEPVISPDGRRVVAPAVGGAGVWNVDGRRLQLLRTPARPAGPADVAAVAAAAFSGNGRTVAASAAGGGCALVPRQRFWTAVWHSAGRSPSHRFPQAFGIQLDPRGSLVVTGGTAWRTASGARVPSLDGIVGLSPDGRLALVRRDWTATVVRVGSGAAVATLRGFGGFRLDDVAAIFSPDGRRVATLRDDTLRLWDTATGEPLGRLGRAGERVDGLSFSRDGRLVLVTFEDERAATFGAADGSPVSSLTGSYAAISPDGALAAAVRDDGRVDVADLATGLRVAVQTDTGKPLTSASFGATPELLVVTDSGGDLHVLRCAICAPEDELLTQARARLARVSTFDPQRPPVAGIS